MDSTNSRSDAITRSGNRTLGAQRPFEQVDHDDDGAPPLSLFGACGETCLGSPGLETEKFKRLTLTLTQRAEIHLQHEMGSHIPSAIYLFWTMEGFDAHLIHYSTGLLFVKTFFLPVIFFLIRSSVSTLFLFYLI